MKMHHYAVSDGLVERLRRILVIERDLVLAMPLNLACD